MTPHLLRFVPILTLLAATLARADGQNGQFSVAPADELVLSEPRVYMHESARQRLLDRHRARAESRSEAWVEMDWADGEIQSHQGGLWRFEGRLLLSVDGAMAVDETTQTIVRDLKGFLNIETAAGERHWRIVPGNHGGFFAKSMYNPTTGAWGWTLPVYFANEGVSVAATVYIAHVVNDDRSVEFRKAWIHKALGVDRSVAGAFRSLVEPGL